MPSDGARPGREAAPPPVPRAPLPPAHDRMIGRTLGKCRLLKRLGRGGMADVYLAEHQLLQKKVAVKVVPPELARNENLINRFRREAIAAARLDHPNIVHVHDVGEQEGIHFIVMQYVEGGNLQDLLDGRKKLDPREACRVALEVARGLRAAHEAGIVHRDIKPANILLGPRGEVKIVDFGLAFDLDSRHPTTAAGTIMGTPHFLSPEQAQGKRSDERSDIYSLGVCLYTMVTGTRPFSGESPMAILFQQIHEKPRHPREIDPSLPESLSALILKAMEKLPEDRYAKAGDLAADLERFLKGPPARRRTFPPRAAAPAPPRGGRARPRLILAGAGAAALLASLAVLALFPSSTPAPPTSREPDRPAPGAPPEKGAPLPEGFVPHPLADLVLCPHLNNSVTRKPDSWAIQYPLDPSLPDEPHIVLTSRNDLADFHLLAEVNITGDAPEMVGRMLYFNDPVEKGRSTPMRVPLDGLPRGRWVSILMKLEGNRCEVVCDGARRAAPVIPASPARTGRCGFRLKQRGQSFEIRNLQLRVLRAVEPSSGNREADEMARVRGFLSEADRRLVADRDYAPVLLRLTGFLKTLSTAEARNAASRLGLRLNSAFKVVTRFAAALPDERSPALKARDGRALSWTPGSPPPIASAHADTIAAVARKARDVTALDLVFFLLTDGETLAALDLAIEGGDFRPECRPHQDDIVDLALAPEGDARRAAERLAPLRPRLGTANAARVDAARARRGTTPASAPR